MSPFFLLLPPAVSKTQRRLVMVLLLLLLLVVLVPPKTCTAMKFRERQDDIDGTCRYNCQFVAPWNQQEVRETCRTDCQSCVVQCKRIETQRSENEENTNSDGAVAATTEDTAATANKNKDADPESKPNNKNNNNDRKRRKGRRRLQQLQPPKQYRPIPVPARTLAKKDQSTYSNQSYYDCVNRCYEGTNHVEGTATTTGGDDTAADTTTAASGATVEDNNDVNDNEDAAKEGGGSVCYPPSRDGNVEYETISCALMKSFPSSTDCQMQAISGIWPYVDPDDADAYDAFNDCVENAENYGYDCMDQCEISQVYWTYCGSAVDDSYSDRPDDNEDAEEDTPYVELRASGDVHDDCDVIQSPVSDPETLTIRNSMYETVMDFTAMTCTLTLLQTPTDNKDSTTSSKNTKPIACTECAICETGQAYDGLYGIRAKCGGDGNDTTTKNKTTTTTDAGGSPTPKTLLKGTAAAVQAAAERKKKKKEANAASDSAVVVALESVADAAAAATDGTTTSTIATRTTMTLPSAFFSGDQCVTIRQLVSTNK